jgi:hypothetical protein
MNFTSPLNEVKALKLWPYMFNFFPRRDKKRLERVTDNSSWERALAALLCPRLTPGVEALTLPSHYKIHDTHSGGKTRSTGNIRGTVGVLKYKLWKKSVIKKSFMKMCENGVSGGVCERMLTPGVGFWGCAPWRLVLTWRFNCDLLEKTKWNKWGFSIS